MICIQIISSHIYSTKILTMTAKLLAFSTPTQLKFPEKLKKKMMVISKSLMAGGILQNSKMAILSVPCPHGPRSSTFCFSQLPHAVSSDSWAALHLLEVFYPPPETWGSPGRTLGVGFSPPTIVSYLLNANSVGGIILSTKDMRRHFWEWRRHTWNQQINTWWGLLWRGACLSMFGKEEVKEMCLRERGVWETLQILFNF